MFHTPTLVVIVCVVLHAKFPGINGACPHSSGSLHRIGNTPFFIIHDAKDRKKDIVTQKEAYGQCKKHGLKLAKIPDAITLAVVGRSLEKLAEKYKFKDTFYWLDAKYDKANEQYFWGGANQDGAVTYSNFFYRETRPTGINRHVTYQNIHENSNIQQCLMLVLPHFGPWDPDSKGKVKGHQVMFDERDCSSLQTRHALCQSDDKSCKVHISDPFILSEDKWPYFEDGSWIFGDRVFVVNWKYRSFSEAKKYCQDRGLALYSPVSNQDAALIPYLKMWTREITTSQFWTDIKWAPNSSYIKPDGSVHTFKSSNKKGHFTGDMRGRSAWGDKNFCVSMLHAYEFITQMPCPDKSSSKCSWSYIEYIPVNCNNYLATICQHTDPNAKGRKITWKAEYITNVDKALTETALVDFGYYGNKETLRSKYKQTFGSLYCPDGYRMARHENTQWYKKPAKKEEDTFIYDWIESYWVVDYDQFNKSADSKCLVSKPKDKGYERTQRQNLCTAFHFYLCERVDKPIKKWVGNLNKASKMEWREGPQPRPYPINRR